MKLKKEIIAGIIGHGLEYYDIMLYGFFAAIISPQFFPSTDPFITKLISVSTFAAGFIMRPVGSLFFGHLGDKLGRKNALSLSILLITLPTFLIGVLPTYDQIGVWAPVILVVCRLFQGFCLGGEVGGAVSFVLEHADKKEAGFVSSLIKIAAYTGGLLGTLLGTLSTLPWMPGWGWRIPFLMGSIFGLIGYYIRLKMQETKPFLGIQESKKKHIPSLELIKRNKINLVKSFGVCIGFIVPFYLITTYMNEIFKNRFMLPASSILMLNSLLMLVWVIFIPIAGKLSDKIGIRKMMAAAALSLVLSAYPAFCWIDGTLELWKIIAFQVYISLLVIFFSAPFCAVFAFLFPVEKRYSGVGVSYALAATVGGLTPLLAVTLVQWAGNETILSAVLGLSAFVGFICVFSAKEVDQALMSVQEVSQGKPSYI